VKYICVLPYGKDMKLITKGNVSICYRNQIMPYVNINEKRYPTNSNRNLKKKKKKKNVRKKKGNKYF